MLLHTIIPSSTHSFPLFSPSILFSFPPVEFRWAGVLGWSGVILERLILWLGQMPKPNMVAPKNQAWQKFVRVSLLFRNMSVGKQAIFFPRSRFNYSVLSLLFKLE